MMTVTQDPFLHRNNRQYHLLTPGIWFWVHVTKYSSLIAKGSEIIRNGELGETNIELSVEWSTNGKIIVREGNGSYYLDKLKEVDVERLPPEVKAAIVKHNMGLT